MYLSQPNEVQTLSLHCLRISFSWFQITSFSAILGSPWRCRHLDKSQQRKQGQGKPEERGS